jgi:hypothetical protein
MLSTEAISQLHSNLKLLSHSSSVLLHKCPRKYELYKLLGKIAEEEQGDEHLIFGDVVGRGVQNYLEHGDFDRAQFEVFMAWKKSIDDDAGDKARKNFWHALYAVDRFTATRNTILGNYKLAYFDGKPAVELGFSIDCGNGFFYRGFLDALLIDTVRNELVVYEGKTTKNKNIHPAMYKHSGQSIGYAVVIDTLAAKLGLGVKSSYTVRYFVYKTFAYEWEMMPFDKSHTQRALWIKNLLLDIKHILWYAEEGYFPMQGENCYDFFRPCEFFGLCELQNEHLTGGKVPAEKNDGDKYQFKYKLETIIESLMEGVHQS